MSVFSFHLARMPLRRSLQALVRPPRGPGLRHVEVLTGMRLGAGVVSRHRMQLRHVAVFAEWDDEAALAEFLRRHPFGRALDRGWHVRLAFVRRWGMVRGIASSSDAGERLRPDEPVVAVTVARMRLPRLPRFIHWGRPVERQIRDHPEATLTMAALRLPRTVSTFSIWSSTRAMTDMVFGRDAGESGQRHADAMRERERRDFHHEFTTLRFRPLSEHGVWEGRGDHVPWSGGPQPS